MSDSARSKRTVLWLGLPILLTMACADTPPAPPAPDPASEWPLACSAFPPDEAIPNCARREEDDEIVLRPGVMPDDGEPGSIQAVIVEDELLFALASGKTAPAFFYDNGLDYFVEGRARSPRDGKMGFVDESLELVVPRNWDFAFPFENGYARVCTGCTTEREEGGEHSEVTGGFWGYINRDGLVVVHPEYARDELPDPTAALPDEP